ncbi:hypothetical protein E2Q21_22840 [Salmonella enterica subsp. enterica serovar Java]|nr:hypothetical protein [Salmonella enterica]ECD6403536.1 hypothetical protein [Salmonella enterica subsp. enterica serovar Java]EDX3986237.1 hypothetical protein [Salmonella enterica subsp. enterica serovar 4,[5],12:b:-]EAP7757553.1 hypothetical protein [Salmonella enterica]EAQ4528810.1 hypothetical protein [Salmonella enterica]
MRHVPADARQTRIYPVSLENQPGCRSVSDDDLCAWCSRLCYRPGELSLCRLFITDGIWPARVDTDGYAQSCPAFCLNRNTPPGKQADLPY